MAWIQPVSYTHLTMKPDRLRQFEDYLQRLIEGGFSRLLAGRLHPRDVAVQLLRTMEDRARAGGDGRRFAPDVYTVRLSAADHRAILEAEPHLTTHLSNELIEMSRHSGLVLANTPLVRLVVAPNMPVRQFEISATHVDSRMTTQGLAASTGPQHLRRKATLIVNGKTHVEIHDAILRIGRQGDNHIVLPSSVVSRYHAQVRLRRGRYVLFDLNSSHGTWVNDQPIREHVLESGDVVVFAKTDSMIYVEDVLFDNDADTVPDDLENTQVFDTPPRASE
ncbi:MAG: DUF3662 domain-containing protein [Chloroflexi bacterium]|nr:DUF3662 domain-containing protein [Chloroflexota bacterium]